MFATKAELLLCVLHSSKNLWVAKFHGKFLEHWRKFLAAEFSMKVQLSLQHKYIVGTVYRVALWQYFSAKISYKLFFYFRRYFAKKTKIFYFLAKVLPTFVCSSSYFASLWVVVSPALEHVVGGGVGVVVGVVYAHLAPARLSLAACVAVGVIPALNQLTPLTSINKKHKFLNCWHK